MPIKIWAWLPWGSGVARRDGSASARYCHEVAVHTVVYLDSIRLSSHRGEGLMWSDILRDAAAKAAKYNIPEVIIDVECIHIRDVVMPPGVGLLVIRPAVSLTRIEIDMTGYPDRPGLTIHPSSSGTTMLSNVTTVSGR